MEDIIFSIPLPEPSSKFMPMEFIRRPIRWGRSCMRRIVLFRINPRDSSGGAGHSSTMEDSDDNYWHVTTMTISVRDMFERRLGLFPPVFTPTGRCCAILTWAIIRNSFRVSSKKIGGKQFTRLDAFVLQQTRHGFVPRWNSSHQKMPSIEDIRTWWSATSGRQGEWLQVDLGKPCRI